VFFLVFPRVAIHAVYGIGRLILDDAPLLKDNYAIVALINPRPVLVYQIGTHDTRVLVDISEEANVADAMTYMREVCKRLAIRLSTSVQLLVVPVRLLDYSIGCSWVWVV
jgi:hypothetical protein